MHTMQTKLFNGSNWPETKALASGLDGKTAGEGAKEQPGQAVELRFRAPRQGKYDLTLYVLSGKLSAHPPFDIA